MLHNLLRRKKDLHGLHQELNLDNEPFLQDGGAILDMNYRGYHSSTAAKAMQEYLQGIFHETRRADHL